MANETEPTRQSNWHNREWRKKSKAIVEDNNDKKRGEADQAKLPEQRAYLKSMLEGFIERDIFNCDETALFWKMEPRTTLARHDSFGKEIVEVLCIYTREL